MIWRGGLLHLGVCAVLLMSGCSGTPATPRPNSASVTAGPLTMALSIPAAPLKASSMQTATTSVANASDATVTMADAFRFTILDSNGNTVYQSIPASPRYLMLARSVGPHMSVASHDVFTVPSAGSYTLEVIEGNRNRFNPPPSVRFDSVP